MSILVAAPIPNKLDDHFCTCLIHISSTDFVILGSREGALLKFNSEELEIEKIHDSGLCSIDALCESSQVYLEKAFWVGGSNSIILYDLNFREITRKEGHQDSVIGMAEVDSFLYSASEDCQVIQWDLPNNNSEVLYQHDSPIITFDLNKEQQKIATACADSILIVYSLIERRIIYRFEDMNEKIWSLKIFNEGLITGDNSGTVKYWNLANGNVVEIKTEHESRVKSICFNEKKRIFATCSFDSLVTIIDADNFNVLGRSGENEIRDWNRCSVFNDRGDKLYTICDDKSLFEWTFENPRNGSEGELSFKGYAEYAMNTVSSLCSSAMNLTNISIQLPSFSSFFRNSTR